MFVYVYGTLKRGYYNHLEHLSGAKFIGNFKTKPNYEIYCNGSFPYLIEIEPGKGKEIEGEVYEVTEEQTRRMDRLEGHPEYYIRKLVELQGIEEVQAYVYPHSVKGCRNCGTIWE